LQAADHLHAGQSLLLDHWGAGDTLVKVSPGELLITHGVLADPQFVTATSLNVVFLRRLMLAGLALVIYTVSNTRFSSKVSA
jgi:hypothetical protein